MSRFEPRIIGFLCHWCSYASADRAGQSKYALPPGFSPVRVTCTGRVRAEQIRRALQAGADGVLVLGCHPKDCHYRTGNLRARTLVGLTARLLEGLGVAPGRVCIASVSPLEAERLVDLVEEHRALLRPLGPFRAVAAAGGGSHA